MDSSSSGPAGAGVGGSDLAAWGLGGLGLSSAVVGAGVVALPGRDVGYHGEPVGDGDVPVPEVQFGVMSGAQERQIASPRLLCTIPHHCESAKPVAYQRV